MDARSLLYATLAGLLMLFPVFWLSASGKPLLFPFMMAGFALTVVSLAASMDSQRLAVVAKDDQLQVALDARNQRERIPATVLDTVPVGLVVVDASGHDQLMNATQLAYHALGIPAPLQNPAEKDLLVFGANKVNVLAAEDRPVRRSVTDKSFTTARTMLDADGSYDGAVVAFHDITNMLAALSAKDDFLASVSHEFRTR